MLGGGIAPVGTIFGSNAGQVPGFTLNYYPAPEPSTPRLVGLRLAALIALRRNKLSRDKAAAGKAGVALDMLNTAFSPASGSGRVL